METIKTNNNTVLISMQILTLLLLLPTLITCGNGKSAIANTSNKEIKIKSPKDNTRYTEGNEIKFEIPDNNADSLIIYQNGNPLASSSDTIIHIKAAINEKYGYQTFHYETYKEGHITKSSPTYLVIFPQHGPDTLHYKIIKQRIHNVDNFTQGLFYDEGILYESTGLYGNSKLIATDLESYATLREHRLDSTMFGEGACLLGDKIYQLTWREKTGFVYDKKTFQLLKKFSYNTEEGWGLTTDGESLIMTDGTHIIYFLDPENFVEKRRIEVCHTTGFIDGINELEYVDGKIWANVFMLNVIIAIDPTTGKIEKILDCTTLRRNEITNMNADIMNGIAYNPKLKHWYVTGKNWQFLYYLEVF